MTLTTVTQRSSVCWCVQRGVSVRTTKKLQLSTNVIYKLRHEILSVSRTWRGDQVLHTKTFYWHHNTEICLLQSPWFISLTLKSDLWYNWHHLLCVCMLNKRFPLCDGVLRQTKHFLPCPVWRGNTVDSCMITSPSFSFSVWSTSWMICVCIRGGTRLTGSGCWFGVDQKLVCL